MKKELEIGERVRVYGALHDYGGKLTKGTNHDGIIATVVGRSHRFNIKCEDESGAEFWCSEKQCRRLKPKKRREFWIGVMAVNPTIRHVFNRPEEADKNAYCSLIHVREVK